MNTLLGEIKQLVQSTDSTTHDFAMGYRTGVLEVKQLIESYLYKLDRRMLEHSEAGEVEIVSELKEVCRMLGALE